MWCNLPLITYKGSTILNHNLTKSSKHWTTYKWNEWTILSESLIESIYYYAHMVCTVTPIGFDIGLHSIVLNWIWTVIYILTRISNIVGFSLDVVEMWSTTDINSYPTSNPLHKLSVYGKYFFYIVVNPMIYNQSGCMKESERGDFVLKFHEWIIH